MVGYGGLQEVMVLERELSVLRYAGNREAQLQEDRQREGILNSSRVEYQLWKLQVECFKLEDSVKNQAEEIEEIENQLLREDLIGDKKKQQDKLIQLTQSLACALEQEKEKTEESEKELHRFMKVLKVIRKKLNECENRELHFYEDMQSRTFEMLRHEINYLKETWDPIHCRYLRQDINIQSTEQELLKIKTDQDNYEHTHKTQENVEKEVLILKSLIKETMTQREEEKKLEKLRENNNDSRMSQMVLRIKNLESNLPEIKSQVDSTRREMEKCKQLYAEEIKSRKSLSNTLRKTMGRLEASTTKLMWVNQQKITLGTILSSLPVQEFPHVAVGHSPSSPLRDASYLLTLESQPVCERVRKDLSEVFCISSSFLMLSLLRSNAIKRPVVIEARSPEGQLLFESLYTQNIPAIKTRECKSEGSM
ncbi:ankyrin repeat domain-containing protein 26-like [Arvicola amphibius]|uniref:ankyrin repeat domain-containing protein 26-like n=1 Tax=Arvicola amphibius TaxID=1047088 RepID=UPI001C09FC07|nr:ankyrin repeat domain-containing protein 26-like [Arvicola amphibius]